MKRDHFVLLFILVMSVIVKAQMVFEPSEYACRRYRLMDGMDDGIAVLQGAQLPTGFYPFYQTNDFYYLTGVEIPNAILIVDGMRRESHLFFTLSERAALCRLSGGKPWRPCGRYHTHNRDRL